MGEKLLVINPEIVKNSNQGLMIFLMTSSYVKTVIENTANIVKNILYSLSHIKTNTGYKANS